MPETVDWLAEPTPYDLITIVRDPGGSWRLEDGTVPPFLVSWSPELLLMLEAGCAGDWISLSDGVITMHLADGPLRYRLTGDRDVTGGHVAELVRDE